MSWKQNGTIADRLKALQVSDSLLKADPNDPMGASMMQQAPMNTPGPNGAAMPLTPGEGDYSGVGDAINQLVESFDMQADLIEMIEKAISQQAKAGVVTDVLRPVSQKIGAINSALKELKYATMAIHGTKDGSVTMNDPTQSMSPMGNARLQSGTASPMLSPQGNMGMGGQY